MATNPPPQSFEVGSCWPRWDNNRSALLAWTEHAQSKRFLVKEQHSKYHIVLSCAVCSRSSSRAPYAVEIEFDGVDEAEKVVAISLKHNHRISALSPAEAAAQEKEITQRRADLFEYALNELKSIKRCGGPEKLKPSEREVGQDRVLEDVRRALGDESAEDLLKSATKQGFLVEVEAEMDSRAVSLGSAEVLQYSC
ncbi:hypothetical protein BCR35DRAFT_36616 [Leucosporidium creatinivorum]|uniref:Uncharacterized protein n=1 Tax=Leucosporidium creatinivorum TaxID=106004 RepID=A0A1Y2C974_9BASI|nr:hypothetical protein BCR35DRAFT_36616 [Leucosporidium creatinivorum]